MGSRRIPGTYWLAWELLAGLALAASVRVPAHLEPGEQALVGLQISRLGCSGTVGFSGSVDSLASRPK